MGKKVIFCVPTMTKPHQACLDSLGASIPAIVSAGWEEGMVNEIGCPYISCARSTMLRKALDAKADVIVFIDHDLSWDAEDLLKLIEMEGDVVAGTYRFKRDEEEYMGKVLAQADGTPVVLEDGSISAFCIPGGFIKITKEAVNRLIDAYPELIYGDRFSPSIDLFNHGAYKGVWYGEDYAFSRRWLELGGVIKLLPNLNLNHHSGDTAYPGNFHNFLLRQPGGSEAPKGESTCQVIQ